MSGHYLSCNLIPNCFLKCIFHLMALAHAINKPFQFGPFLLLRFVVFLHLSLFICSFIHSCHSLLETRGRCRVSGSQLGAPSVGEPAAPGLCAPAATFRGRTGCESEWDCEAGGTCYGNTNVNQDSFLWPCKKIAELFSRTHFSVIK